MTIMRDNRDVVVSTAYDDDGNAVGDDVKGGSDGLDYRSLRRLEKMEMRS